MVYFNCILVYKSRRHRFLIPLHCLSGTCSSDRFVVCLWVGVHVCDANLLVKITVEGFSAYNFQTSYIQ